MADVRKLSSVFRLMAIMNYWGYIYDIWYEGTSLTYVHRVYTDSLSQQLQTQRRCEIVSLYPTNLKCHTECVLA